MTMREFLSVWQTSNSFEQFMRAENLQNMFLKDLL